MTPVPDVLIEVWQAPAETLPPNFIAIPGERWTKPEPWQTPAETLPLPHLDLPSPEATGDDEAGLLLGWEVASLVIKRAQNDGAEVTEPGLFNSK